MLEEWVDEEPFPTNGRATRAALCPRHSLPTPNAHSTHAQCALFRLRTPATQKHATCALCSRHLSLAQPLTHSPTLTRTLTRELTVGNKDK